MTYYNFKCDECGQCLDEDRMAAHAYERGHEMFKYIGIKKGEVDE